MQENSNLFTSRYRSNKSFNRISPKNDNVNIDNFHNDSKNIKFNEIKIRLFNPQSGDNNNINRGNNKYFLFNFR